MKINYSDLNLSQKIKDEISRLLNSIDHDKDDLETIWQLMDMVWDEYACDNKKLNWNDIGKFYSHPVWILNGLFIEQHAVSMQHRNAISDWIVAISSISKILDYGGGFGTIARLVSDKNSSLSVDIYEPYPSDYSKHKISDYPQIQFTINIKTKYDVLVSTDILEHVPEPLRIFQEMILAVKNDGYLIIANNFSPIIKCHLPQTFHLRYTFNFFAKLMGLMIVGPLEGSHATIFKKESNKPINWYVIRSLERISKGLFSMIEFAKLIFRPI